MAQIPAVGRLSVCAAPGQAVALSSENPARIKPVSIPTGWLKRGGGSADQGAVLSCAEREGSAHGRRETTQSQDRDGYSAPETTSAKQITKHNNFSPMDP